MRSQEEQSNTPGQSRLFTSSFAALNAIAFLAVCNFALFFQFHEYLKALPINPEWYGLLIALFSFAALVVRPIISPFVHPANARRWLATGLILTIASLLTYNWGQGLWSMAVVRVIHGAAYVLVMTATLAALVGRIPQQRSSQAFGLISVVSLVPFSIIPPALGPLIAWTGSFDRVLDLFAVVMGLCFLLLPMVEGPDGPEDGRPVAAIGLREMFGELASLRIQIPLWLIFLVWTAFSAVFYFLEGYGRSIGVANPGWFLTLATASEIGVRLLAGGLFDRVDKARALAVSCLAMAAGYLLLAHTPNPGVFCYLGIALGTAWGVTMPLLNGLVFDLSEPRYRALNTNLGMQAVQVGFFVGPLAGGLINIHWGYSLLYYVCAAIAVAAAGLAGGLASQLRRARGGS